MNQEEQDFLQEQEAQLSSMKSQSEMGQVGMAQQQMAMEQAEGNIIKEQLDLSDIKEEMGNLLRGRYQEMGPDNIMIWKDPTDNRDVLLSEAGVQFVLNSMGAYLNKNTLLSNFDEETILQKMEDYSISLADVLFMRYERYFLYPTDKECELALKEKLKTRTEKKLFISNIRNEKKTYEELYKVVLNEIDLDKELIKIKEQMVKDKLKGFEHLIRQVQDAVHSAYNRAYKGMERTSIRKRIHVSESVGGPRPQQQSKGVFNWLRPNN